MKIAKYLKDHQKSAYHIFLNALNHKRLAHAYLLSGSQGIPLLDIALFFTRTLICQNRTEYACEECPTCLRIKEGNYADLIILDGSKESIKKDTIQELESRFSKTAIEGTETMIYVIHLVENMTTEAINSLLKFLEEPGKNIFAFLTTENEYRVLPTILSRSQVLHFKPVSAENLKNEALELGTHLDDVELLINFYYEPNTIKKVSEDENFIKAKKCFLKSLEALNSGKNTIFPILHKEIMPNLKTKESIRFYLDLMQISFTDLLNLQLEHRITLTSYVNILDELRNKLSHLNESLLEIMLVRTQVDLNVNTNLLLDHLMIFILKGDV